jgi:SH3 domain protein
MASQVAHAFERRNRNITRIARVLGLAIAVLLATSASAETAWVKDEVRLNLRSGPGTKYRILHSIGTGDKVDVLNRGEGWTEVRSEAGEGWIPEGFLQPEAPAAVRLERLEAQTTGSRAKLEALTAKTTELETENATLSEQEGAQKSEIELLTRENLELKAGARWPEWITGAGILAVGMLMGAILQSVSGRRSRPRIRL